jgi:hypothetical protein
MSSSAVLAGIAVGGVLLLGLFAFVLHRYRKKHTDDSKVKDNTSAFDKWEKVYAGSSIEWVNSWYQRNPSLKGRTRTRTRSKGGKTDDMGDEDTAVQVDMDMDAIYASSSSDFIVQNSKNKSQNKRQDNNSHGNGAAGQLTSFVLNPLKAASSESSCGGENSPRTSGPGGGLFSGRMGDIYGSSVKGSSDVFQSTNPMMQPHALQRNTSQLDDLYGSGSKGSDMFQSANPMLLATTKRPPLQRSPSQMNDLYGSGSTGSGHNPLSSKRKNGGPTHGGDPLSSGREPNSAPDENQAGPTSQVTVGGGGIVLASAMPAAPAHGTQSGAYSDPRPLTSSVSVAVTSETAGVANGSSVDTSRKDVTKYLKLLRMGLQMTVVVTRMVRDGFCETEQQALGMLEQSPEHVRQDVSSSTTSKANDHTVNFTSIDTGTSSGSGK